MTPTAEDGPKRPRSREGSRALVRCVLDKIVFGKILDRRSRPEYRFSVGRVGLVAVVEELELVGFVGRFLVARRDFAAVLVEVFVGVCGVFPEDVLPPSQGLRFWPPGVDPRGAGVDERRPYSDTIGGVDHAVRWRVPRRIVAAFILRAPQAEGLQGAANVRLFLDDFEQAQPALAQRALQRIAAPDLQNELAPAGTRRSGPRLRRVG